MIKQSLVAAALAAALMVMPTGSASAAKSDRACSSAVSVVERAGAEGLGAVKSRSKARFHQVFMHYADVQRMARFALGRYARRMSAGDRKRYFKLASTRLVETVRKGLADMKTHSLAIKGCSQKGKSLVVDSDLVLKSGKRLAVKWRLGGKGGKRVVDMNVFGIWLAVHYRTEFAGIIAQGGGDVSTLLDHLRGRSVISSVR